jgi:hypothetical protein
MTENTAPSHREHRGRGDLRDQRGGRGLHLRERPVCRHPCPPGDHRPGWRTGSPQGGRRSRPHRPRHRRMDHQRSHARQYFPNKLHQQIVNEPFVDAAARGPLRRDRPHPRRRHRRSGRRPAPGRGPRAQRRRRRGQPPDAEEGRSADPRRPRGRAQEGRSQEGPQGSASTASADLLARLFGTDGVRGLANGALTAELALDLSVAAAHVLGDRGEFEGHRPRRRRGRDTRISGQFLEAAVVAGLASAGVDVLLLGVVPTPGRGLPDRPSRRRSRRHALGQPQPMPDNGIKFFSRGGGKKLDDAIEVADRAAHGRGVAAPDRWRRGARDDL